MANVHHGCPISAVKIIGENCITYADGIVKASEYRTGSKELIKSVFY